MRTDGPLTPQPQRRRGSRSHDAIHLQPSGTPLKLPDRILGRGTEDAVDRQTSRIQRVLIPELTLKIGDLRTLGSAEHQDIRVLADRHRRTRCRGWVADRTDTCRDIGSEHRHVDGSWIPLALCATGILLVSYGSAGVLRESPIDCRATSHQRGVLRVRPVQPMRRRRARPSVGAFDADEMPVAHVGGHPRVHANAGVPGDAHRDDRDRAVARDVQLRQWACEVGPPLAIDAALAVSDPV